MESLVKVKKRHRNNKRDQNLDNKEENIKLKEFNSKEECNLKNNGPKNFDIEEIPIETSQQESKIIDDELIISFFSKNPTKKNKNVKITHPNSKEIELKEDEENLKSIFKKKQVWKDIDLLKPSQLNHQSFNNAENVQLRYHNKPQGKIYDIV